MKKAIIINIIIILTVFFIIDYYLFFGWSREIKLRQNYFQFITRKIAVSDDYDKERLYSWPYRSPLNQDKEGKSIIFAGCSFIYGDGIKENETLPYLLSKKINRPIYNLALSSTSLNHMLAMLQLGIYEDKVKIPPQAVIYTYLDFHAQRLVIPNIIFEPNEYLYIIKNNNLIRKRPPFIVERFSLLDLINRKIYSNFYKDNIKQKQYLCTLLKMHILAIKKELNKKYGDIKFIIFVYNEAPLFNSIENELKSNGIIIIKMTEDIGIYDIDDMKYHLNDGHPNAESWQIVAPKLYDKLTEYIE